MVYYRLIIKKIVLRGCAMSNLRHQFKADTGQVIEIWQGDLTQESCDAIVNAANTYLSHGGGVAGAIVRVGGYEIQVESNRWVEAHGTVPTGQVAVTRAGKLHCQWVIHAVGPVWKAVSYTHLRAHETRHDL